MQLIYISPFILIDTVFNTFDSLILNLVFRSLIIEDSDGQLYLIKRSDSKSVFLQEHGLVNL